MGRLLDRHGRLLNGVVEQGGTEAICEKGIPHDAVWWEMFPFNAIKFAFAISV